MGGTVRLSEAVAFIRASALERKAVFMELGVFLLYTNSDGDAWLLEMTEGDGVQLAENGSLRDVSIEESPETIVVDWTHSYAIHRKRLQLFTHGSKVVNVVKNAPSGEIHGAMRRLRKNHSSAFLKTMHLDKDLVKIGQ